MSEALALRQLAAAIEKREKVLAFLKIGDGAEVALGSQSGLTIATEWGRSCDGYSETMRLLATELRCHIPMLLQAVRQRLDAEVTLARVQLREAYSREAA